MAPSQTRMAWSPEAIDALLQYIDDRKGPNSPFLNPQDLERTCTEAAREVNEKSQMNVPALAKHVHSKCKWLAERIPQEMRNRSKRQRLFIEGSNIFTKEEVEEMKANSIARTPGQDPNPEGNSTRPKNALTGAVEVDAARSKTSNLDKALMSSPQNATSSHVETYHDNDIEPLSDQLRSTVHPIQLEQVSASSQSVRSMDDVRHPRLQISYTQRRPENQHNRLSAASRQPLTANQTIQISQYQQNPDEFESSPAYETTFFDSWAPDTPEEEIPPGFHDLPEEDLPWLSSASER